jgi:hypothetical protein
MPPKTAKPPSNRHWIILLMGFVLVIVIPHVRPSSLPVPVVAENRRLAEWPTLPAGPSELASRFDGLDKYLRDHFPLRSDLIAGVNWLRYRAGYSHTDRILVGRQGWLFFDDGGHLSFYRGRRVDDVELTALVKGFGDRETQVFAAGARFYAIFPPYKPGIYSEYLPKGFRKIPPISELDQVIAGLNGKGADEIIDVRKILMQGKETAPTYTPYDTHWSGYGAYLAYRALMTRLGKDFPDLHPDPLDSFDHHRVSLAAGPSDLAAMLGVLSFIQFDLDLINTPAGPGRHIDYLTDRQDWTAPHVLTTGYSGPTLLMVRDSFSLALVPFLERHFSKIVLIHHQDDTKTLWLDRRWLERLRPDIVLLEVQEQGVRFALRPLAD